MIGTGAITLQEVCIELYGAAIAGQSLAQCFIDATGSFDPIYGGAKDRLSNFRGYSHLTQISFAGESYGHLSAIVCCNESASAVMGVVWTTGDDTPDVGDRLFTDSAGANPFNGIDQWFYSKDSLEAIQVDDKGYCIATSECAGGPI